MQESLLNEVVEARGRALDRFVLLYRRVYQALSENPSLFRMIHGLLFGPLESVPSYDYDRFHRRMLRAVEAIYSAGASRKEVVDADPEEVAMLVLGVMDFCLRQDQTRAGAPDSSRPERLLRLMFQGLERKAGDLDGLSTNSGEVRDETD
jgi:hypothetical protein